MAPDTSLRCCLGWIVMVLLAALALGCTAETLTTRRSATSSAPPNIVFILSDDQRFGTESCMPQLQKLVAQRGVTFTEYSVSTSLCCPSRSTILTGLYAHNHGVLSNGDVEDGDTVRTAGALDFQNNGNEQLAFARWLQGAGYRTGFFGKYMNGYEDLVFGDRDGDGKRDRYAPPFWDVWRAFAWPKYFHSTMVEYSNGAAHAEVVCYVSNIGVMASVRERCKSEADRVVDDGNENYSTDLLSKQLARFIEESAALRQPFFAYFAPYAPHSPAQSPRRYQSNPLVAQFTSEALAKMRHCSLFDWQHRPPSFMEEDVSDKPEWVVNLVGTTTREQFDESRRKQLISTLAVDDALQQISDTLHRVGAADNTIIVYTSDNGYSWGEHWWGKKNCTYDSCSRVPLLAMDGRSPRIGAQESLFAMNIDLASTFAELAGAEIPAHFTPDGASIAAAILGSGAMTLRNDTLWECFGNTANGGPGTHASVRTADWKYVEHYADGTRTTVHTRQDGRPELELYDLKRDPHELDNLLLIGPSALQGMGYNAAEISATSSRLEVRLRSLRDE